MTRDHPQVRPGEGEHLGDELAETARAHQQDPVAWRDAHLFEYLERGGKRLGEDGGLVAHRVWHAVEVCERERGVLGVDSVAVHDS